MSYLGVAAGPRWQLGLSEPLPVFQADFLALTDPLNCDTLEVDWAHSEKQVFEELSIMATQEWSDEIVVVDLPDEPEFTDELNSLTERMEQAAKDVVLNFVNLRFLNSSNISRLLKLRKVLVDRNRRLLLCAIPVQIWGVFLLTGLDSLFDVAEDAASALASLQMK